MPIIDKLLQLHLVNGTPRIVRQGDKVVRDGYRIIWSDALLATDQLHGHRYRLKIGAELDRSLALRRGLVTAKALWRRMEWFGVPPLALLAFYLFPGCAMLPGTFDSPITLEQVALLSIAHFNLGPFERQSTAL